MQQPQNNLLTVVIPVHNRPKLIRRAIECVVAQTYRPFSLIVVDNNSTDNTLQIVTNLAQQHSGDSLPITVLSEPTPGATFARNRGLDAVTGEWTMFFDSDDIMHPAHIAQAMAAVQAHPDADIVGWNTDYINLDGSRRRVPFEVRDIAFHNLFHGTLATQRYMARTALFSRAGGWNTQIPMWNDIELGARLLALNPRIVKSASSVITVTVEAQANSITGANLRSRINSYAPALNSIRRTLPARCKHWVDLKEIIFAAGLSHEDAAAARTILSDVISRTACPVHRLLWRLAYAYTARSHRGIARLLRPLL